MECTKKSYETPYEAQKALAKADIRRMNGGHHSHETSFYRCPECLEWHLTSGKTDKEKQQETARLELIELESVNYKAKNRKKLKKRR